MTNIAHNPPMKTLKEMFVNIINKPIQEYVIAVSENTKTKNSTDQGVLRAATNQLMEKIAQLSKQEYVPDMYASDAKEAIQKSGAKSLQEIGKIMGILMPQIKGRADGGLVNKIVREEMTG